MSSPSDHLDLPMRRATAADIPAIHALVERGSREKGTGGWTSESDLFESARTDPAALVEIIADPQQQLLVAADAAGIFGCVVVAAKDAATAYMGLLCVDPARQAAGIGRRLIAAAEAAAAQHFGAAHMEMTVIDRRHDLIEYYRRRGYEPTGEIRPMPAAAGPTTVPVALRVLSRVIGAARPA
jgi:predicted N-acetyltransferase YhbS